MGQTVNLLSFDFGGSNPSLPTKRGAIIAPRFFLCDDMVVSQNTYITHSLIAPAAI